MDECPFCQEFSDIKTDARTDGQFINCPRCGKYKITLEAFTDLRSEGFEPRERSNISAWLRENERSHITTNILEGLHSLKTPSFHERADKLLMALERKTIFIGEKIKRDKSWISSAWCINDKELNEIISYLVSAGRIALSNTSDFSECKIAFNGWEHLEQLKRINADSPQGFVAMWFEESLKKIYDEVIAPAIIEAGYKPHRVDQREHNNKIDDEIIAEIRRSRFVLADFTGHRGGVYFEAGFAKGLGIEVFWTCRKDDIENLHFDIRQYNCIEWEPDKLDEFKRRITLRIESVLGRGIYTR
ncbi:MAG: hypothetical protein HY893_05455 [Deltaproteobacteria bacterium]|nr:hypothetical protein [Deltaproteobacteria bacterium]